jgi:mannose-6-phosphate isomerase-like protein (cupin superfamily)
MDFTSAKDFTGQAAWDALDLLEFHEPVTVRLHWTDAPYIWHVNDGEEVFAVLDGEDDMHYRSGGVEKVVHMRAGDICRAGVGDEHVARPRGQARVLVVEKKGSV